MNKLTLIAVTLCLSCLVVYTAERPKPEEFAKQYGDLFAVDLKTEEQLHQTKIPEVVFAQASMSDVVHFLNQAIVKKREHQNPTPKIRIDATDIQNQLPAITFAGKDVSVLQVLRFIQNVTDLHYRITKDKEIILAIRYNHKKANQQVDSMRP